MDDLGGLPDEHSAAPQNMNLSASEVAEIRAATAVFVGAVFDTVWAAGKYVSPPPSLTRAGRRSSIG